MTEMSPAEAIFFAALEKTTPAERLVYLDEACANQPELRARVEKLLAAHPRVGGFLQPDVTVTAPGSDNATTKDMPSPRTQIGTVLGGKYKLVEEIGEGGMGSVYLAVQTEPVKRRVAVKVIKAGMDSHQVIARFEAERQALAVMDHPNIAKVLDAGTTPPSSPPHAGGLGGVPYFVMELVKGVPITEYCDAHKLTPRQRLELFVPVCQAIQHAHMKGVIHRDIKPSNVLIALYDDKPVPKVIDFGVAKATGASLTDHSLVTGHGAVVGTPEYMSPEQASFNNLDIDTRSDVYSLGVLLYELLTGSTPVDRKSLGKAALLEILRIVREVEAPKPSAKLSTIDTLPNVAANRGTEPAKLSKLMRGELDWVVLKALEKDRTRRYDTANGLARDIQRYLADEIVEARPPSAGYRLRKFVRRHKGQVIAASLVFVALLAGVVGTTWQAIRAENARRGESVQRELAEGKEREAQFEKANALQAAAAEKAANAQAQFRLTQIEKGNAVLTSIFDDMDIQKVKEGTEPLEAVLAKRLVKAAEQLEGDTVGDPLAVAKLQNKLGESLLSLGFATDAIPLFQKARATRTSKLGADHPDTLDSAGNLASGYRAAGKLDLALPLFEETLKLQKAKLGADHIETLISMGNLALGYQAVGKLDLALPLFEETLKLRKVKLGADHRFTLYSMSNLASGYKAVGKLDLALPLYEETLKLTKAKLGADHPSTLIGMRSLALGYLAAGKLDLALPLLEETLKLTKAKLGADHPSTLIGMASLAFGYQAAGKLDLALPLYEETLKLTKAKLGADHPETLTSMSNLAAGYHHAGKLDLALPLLEETLKLTKAKLGADHPATLTSMNNLATGYEKAGKLDLALPLYEETLKLQKAQLGANHPSTLTTMNNLAGGYHHAGKLDLALPLYEETLKLTKTKQGAEHPDTLLGMSNLAAAYVAIRKLDLALPLIEETLKLQKAKLGADHPDTLTTMNNLASSYRAVGKLDLALPLYEETLKLRKAKLGADHPSTLESMASLAAGYWSANRLDRSIPLFEETLKLQEAKLGRQHPDTLLSVANLGVNYKDAGRLAEALPLLEEAHRVSKQHASLRFIGQQLLDGYVQAGKSQEAATLVAELLNIARTTLPKESPQLAQELVTIGYARLQLKAFADAEPLLRECLTIREKTQPDVWTTINTQSLLGGALLGQKKYADAEPLLLKGYEGLKAREKTIPEPSKVRLPEAIDRLIELYTATNNPDDAKKWRTERAKYPEVAPMPRVVVK